MHNRLFNVMPASIVHVIKFSLIELSIFMCAHTISPGSVDLAGEAISELM